MPRLPTIRLIQTDEPSKGETRPGLWMLDSGESSSSGLLPSRRSARGVRDFDNPTGRPSPFNFNGRKTMRAIRWSGVFVCLVLLTVGQFVIHPILHEDKIMGMLFLSIFTLFNAICFTAVWLALRPTPPADGRLLIAIGVVSFACATVVFPMACSQSPSLWARWLPYMLINGAATQTLRFAFFAI